MKYKKLTRYELLAAEIFNYSYANYSDHEGHPRFDRFMPDHVKILEKAAKEKWPLSKLAKKLEIDEEQAMEFLKDFHDACKVVDVPNPSESFREGIRQQLRYMLKGKVDDEAELDKIVIQICYRAADLGNLLEWEGSRLINHSEWLRREPDCDVTDIGLPNLPKYGKDGPIEDTEE